MTIASTRTCAKLGAALLCCTILSLLSGCSVFHSSKKGGCTEKPFSLSTETRPPLKVPEGLSAPDTRNAIKVPELSNPERVRAASEPCLSHPPDYFNKPLEVTKPAHPPKKGKGSAPAATTPASAPPTPGSADTPPPK